MEHPLSDTSDSRPAKVRWAWFVLGCSCLILGSLYLGFADLGEPTVTVELGQPRPTVTTAEIPQATGQ